MEHQKKKRFIAVMAAVIFAASFPAQAGQWRKDENGWWWQEDDGSYPVSWSRWLDGNGDGVYELYYFDENGYLYTDTSLFDGMVQVNADGASLHNETVATMDHDPDEEIWQLGRTANGEPKAEMPDEEALARAVLCAVNLEREKQGREALTENGELMENAKVRAAESADPDCAPHKRPDGSSYLSAITAEYEKASENLAYIGYMPGDDVQSLTERIVGVWLDSPGHRRNLLRSEWEETGVGVCIEGTKVIVSQLYIDF